MPGLLERIALMRYQPKQPTSTLGMLRDEAQFRQTMLPVNLQQERIKQAFNNALKKKSLMDRLNFEISGGINDGLLSGGGTVSMNMPMSETSSLTPYFSGGGAFGSVKTPNGRMKIREFYPDEIGVRYRKEF